jgi:hypothetical protein
MLPTKFCFISPSDVLDLFGRRNDCVRLNPDVGVGDAIPDLVVGDGNPDLGEGDVIPDLGVGVVVPFAFIVVLGT